jgi:hypothetical protein
MGPFILFTQSTQIIRSNATQPNIYTRSGSFGPLNRYWHGSAIGNV